MATTKAFRQGDHIGFDIQLLVAPELAAATHPHLIFVKDQENVALIAVATDRTEHLGITWMDTALALERLAQDSANPRAMGLEAV